MLAVIEAIDARSEVCPDLTTPPASARRMTA
jgi:hypothetical protein